MSDLNVTTVDPETGRVSFRFPRGQLPPVVGRFQLAQQVVVNFLKYPGADQAFPDVGGGFLRTIGQIYSLETLSGAAISAIIATEQQIRTAQSTSGVTRQNTERLVSATFIDAVGDISAANFSATVRIAVQSTEGPPVVLTVNPATVAVGGATG